MMRLTVILARPLDEETRIRASLAAAALAKTTRIQARRGSYQIEVFGEAMSRDSLRDALRAEGVEAERIDTTLDEAEDALADDHGRAERVRAIGR